VIAHLAATAANCNVGTWTQKWDCGWNHPNPAAYRAGYDFGHNVLPVLILLAFVLLVARAARRRKAARRKVEPAAKAWKRAEIPARR
jgi:hypothetical protein